MTGCHSCPVAVAIADGVYKDEPWEKIPCSTCKIGTGGFALEFDENRLPDENAELSTFTPELYERSVMPVAVMRDLVVGLLKLPPALRDVVAWRFAGMGYQEIADLQGVSMAAAEKRHRRALELWPELEAMFAEKMAKQKRRKPHAA